MAADVPDGQDKLAQLAAALLKEIGRRGLDRRRVTRYELGVIAREVLPPDLVADLVEAAREAGEDPVEFTGLFVDPLLEDEPS